MVTSTPLCERSSRVESQHALNTIIEETRQKHKSLAVYWLDFANAFGSVHSSLIHFTLKHYYVCACIVEAVCKCTRVLIVGLVHTKEWSTVLFLIVIRICQGDPLSVITFNTMMNTLVDTMMNTLVDTMMNTLVDTMMNTLVDTMMNTLVDTMMNTLVDTMMKTLVDTMAGAG